MTMMGKGRNAYIFVAVGAEQHVMMMMMMTGKSRKA